MTDPSPRFCSACGAKLTAAARFCAQCGTAVATTEAPGASDGERRQATVMFADLCGYTALSQLKRETS